MDIVISKSDNKNKNIKSLSITRKQFILGIRLTMILRLIMTLKGVITILRELPNKIIANKI